MKYLIKTKETQRPVMFTGLLGLCCNIASSKKETSVLACKKVKNVIPHLQK